MERISWKAHKFQTLMKSFFHAEDSWADGIICAEGFGIHLHERQMVVSHLASGKRIASFATIGGAFRYCDAVLPFTRHIEDWHSPECSLSPEDVVLFQGAANSAIVL